FHVTGVQTCALPIFDVKGINPWADVLSEADFRKHFGYQKHRFTGVDYIEYYKELIEAEGATCEIIFSNNAKTILDYTEYVLACEIGRASCREGVKVW